MVAMEKLDTLMLVSKIGGLKDHNYDLSKEVQITGQLQYNSHFVQVGTGKNISHITQNCNVS